MPFYTRPVGSASKPKTDEPRRKRGRGADTAQMRADLTRAAFDSLREDGFRGSTARAIAARANCNQAAIYYHFGGIEALWIHALKTSGEERLERYRERLDGETMDLSSLVAAIEELYSNDRDTGHLDVLTELMGGVTAYPDIGAGVAEVTQPWLDFVEGQVRAAAQRHKWGKFVPAEDAADMIFSMIIGLQLRSRADGRTDRAERLFRLAGLAAGLAQAETKANTDADTDGKS